MPEMPIRMPKMSMTMEEGEFGSWLISVGDSVTKGMAVAVVMTDKVEMEVESEVEGTVMLLRFSRDAARRRRCRRPAGPAPSPAPGRRRSERPARRAGRSGP